MSDPRVPATPAVAGIVLAGGKASRFGRDKLAEPLDGRPLIHHALIALSPVVDELLLVLSPEGEVPSLPDDGLRGVAVRLVCDPEPFAGPLVGLTAALEATAAPVALLVGGDMPGLEPTVLAAMLVTLEGRDADVVLLDAPGPVQSMPAAIRTAPARLAARQLSDQGGRALRALYDRLHITTLELEAWLPLDPGRRTLRDVDTPADLAD